MNQESNNTLIVHFSCDLSTQGKAHYSESMMLYDIFIIETLHMMPFWKLLGLRSIVESSSICFIVTK